jgi:hypothetical protein
MEPLLWGAITQIYSLVKVSIVVLHLNIWIRAPLFHPRILCLCPLWFIYLRLFFIRICLGSMKQRHFTAHHFLIRIKLCWKLCFISADPFAVYHQHEVTEATYCIFYIIGLYIRIPLSWTFRHALVEHTSSNLDASVYITLSATWHQRLNHLSLGLGTLSANGFWRFQRWLRGLWYHQWSVMWVWMQHLFFIGAFKDERIWNRVFNEFWPHFLLSVKYLVVSAAVLMRWSLIQVSLQRGVVTQD